MTLENLLAIHRLQVFEAMPGGVLRLLASAERNLNDYEGDPVTDAAVRECLVQAEALLNQTRQWLRGHHPDLLLDKP